MNEIGLTQAARERARQSATLAWLAAATALLLAGCVSPKAATQIKNFSTAVSLATGNSAQAYTLMEQEHLDAQFSQAVLDYAGTPFHPDFHALLTTNELQVRMNILEALKLYAARLSTLMGNATVTNLDQDTTKLGQSLNALDSNLVQTAFVKVPDVSSNDVQILAAAVNFLGNWLITGQEQSEARKAITAMQKYVPEICQVLEKDLGYVHNQVTNDFTQNARHMELYLQKSYHDLDPIQRRAELARLVALNNSMKTADAALTLTQSSLEKIETAHQALDQAFTADTSKLSSLINEASGEAQRVAAYYNSLRTNQ
jgi:hypothetical protein